VSGDIEEFMQEVATCESSVPVCAGEHKDLAELDEADRLLLLAALTARFSASYLRRMRSRPADALNFSNGRVLEILETRGPTIMRDIAESLGTTPRNMTAIIDSLEECGSVRRTPHPGDRRATVVELTAAGRKQADQARQEAVARVATAFNSMSLEEQQQYADLLGRVLGFFC
jgi:DNA-binding MarR family transcriptional regulator